ncbi:MAG TPA: 16S rRNA (cytosine(967)-C(5))-methyltransferase RsmB [Syntrophales bacterium]|nr:16S rRNA (cytosine(967)-C(5))-methyltransferase RsmB [Syntrophales bacterium]HPQ06158.1 16S rRNA (cytosine(967)-C(5))-methyltransferase RsmB [Syntrophales bacterium]HRS86382.1 16S rRNA (cytosine(967)-C(5))-methyltransferase RsmB [Syntrophales bacterium]HRV42424.1 16S rRNA (cytosine(967)-C(5))-methyltransferase RsmB [Syntrophales bacterium]
MVSNAMAHRPTAANAARYWAVHILNCLEKGRSFAESLLDRCLRKNIPDPRDRRLLTELVYGTLRMRGYCDWLIGRYLKRPLASLNPPVLNILRTGLYQHFHMDRIPPFAIVHEAVKLTREFRGGSEDLVNAVLRRVFRCHSEPPLPRLERESPLYLSIVHSHPLWLVEKWLDLFGPQETEALCRADNAVPPVVVRVNTLRADRESVREGLTAEGMRAEETPYSPDGLIVKDARQPLWETAAYKRGEIQVQDEASQLVSYCLAPRRGEVILDLCAGVGGKTSHMAALMGNEGRIVAVDASVGRLQAQRRLLERLGVRIVTPLRADATQDLGPEFLAAFDRVLVDAPCSGLGTLRRAPEIRWRRDTSRLDKMTSLQRLLLRRAAAYVRPGGVVVYATCSVLPEENEEIVGDFLDENGGFEVAGPEGLDPSLTDGDGFFRTYPHRHDTDGFFGAVLIRRS